MRNKLEKFVIDNPDFEKLEDALSQFNIFEVLSLERTEIKHSNMLAYLFNPSESHGLSDFFLKKFLMRVVADSNVLDISPVDIDGWNLKNSTIQREHEHIDILIKNVENKFVCCIENKTDSEEHGDQLQRYENVVNKECRSYKKLFIFLSPDGTEPSEGNENWVIATYDQIKNILDNIIDIRGISLGEQQKILIKHYSDTIGRNFVNNSKEIELAQKIYNAHKEALDFIFDNRPKPYKDIKKFVDENTNYISLPSTDSYIRFTTKTIDNTLPKIGGGESGVWASIKNVFVYEIAIKRDSVKLKLLLGPSRNANYRKKAFDAIKANPSTFFRSELKRKFTDQFYSLKSWNLLNDAVGVSSADQMSLIMEAFENAKNDLQDIDKYFQENKEKFQE